MLHYQRTWKQEVQVLRVGSRSLSTSNWRIARAGSEVSRLSDLAKKFVALCEELEGVSSTNWRTRRAMTTSQRHRAPFGRAGAQ
jgi:hypothetical protein